MVVHSVFQHVGMVLLSLVLASCSTRNAQNEQLVGNNENSTAKPLSASLISESSDTASTTPNLIFCENEECRVFFHEFSVMEKKPTLEIAYLAHCNQIRENFTPKIKIGIKGITQKNFGEFVFSEKPDWKILKIAEPDPVLYISNLNTENSKTNVISSQDNECNFKLKFRRAELAAAIHEF
jgi:hypothetical protein